MSTLQPLLDAIEASPEGPQICAIFDFDGTIISGFSAIAFPNPVFCSILATR